MPDNTPCPQTCPKCGSAFRELVRVGVCTKSVWACGAWQWTNEPIQQTVCCKEREKDFTIAELEAANARLRAALQEIADYSECRCDEAWTGRKRHAPECPADIHYTATEALKEQAHAHD